jgi:hypothetical protein
VTGPESKRERDNAAEAAAEAQQAAASLVERGTKIGEKWRQSRADNNFRMMLRSIGKAVNNAS